MDNKFNGLRFSSTLDCLVDDGGRSIRLGDLSTQIFLLLNSNLNKLVTRERLLDKVPTNGSGPDNTLNECIDEIRHIIGDQQLKTIPQVGYLLTPDTKSTMLDQNSKPSNNPSSRRSSMCCSLFGANAHEPRHRSIPALIQNLLFNFQWITSALRNNRRGLFGSLFLLIAFLTSPLNNANSTTSSMGHMAFDRADANTCSALLANCSACLPSVWQSSSVVLQSDWFVSPVCG